MAHLQTLAQRKLQHLLRARGERDVAGHGLGSVADNVDDLAADVVEVNAHGLKRLRCDALALLDQAEQNVLGAHVIVVELARLLLCKDDDTTGPVGKPLEHVADPFFPQSVVPNHNAGVRHHFPPFAVLRRMDVKKRR